MFIQSEQKEFKQRHVNHFYILHLELAKEQHRRSTVVQTLHSLRTRKCFRSF
uniref:Uncharacterized protein n=1 Tax=Anguilla anguilla TaxID=7936 RepID=A0A0E9WQM1_ANGAN